MRSKAAGLATMMSLLVRSSGMICDSVTGPPASWPAAALAAATSPWGAPGETLGTKPPARWPGRDLDSKSFCTVLATSCAVAYCTWMTRSSSLEERVSS